MALFGLGKKKNKPIKTGPSEPSFYDEPLALERPSLEVPEFPIYEEPEPLPEPVGYPESLEIPKRQPQIPKYKPQPLKVELVKFKYKEPEKFHEVANISKKPLFVKVDNYKEALELVDEIGLKLKEATGKLDEIAMLRDDEDKLLRQWRDDVEKIKESLLKIDKDLFEV